MLDVRNASPVFVIAEAGVNHNGDMSLAYDLIATAKRAGADAVKFQTFKIESVLSAAAPMAEYQKANAGAPSAVEMLRTLELGYADFERMAERCRVEDIEFMSTPFDLESAEFLKSIGMTKFKIPSGEVTNEPFIRAMARLGGTIILSTGMSTLAEVHDAVEWLEEEGCRDLTILHCVSNYPAAAESANLRAMDTLSAAFGYDVGWSDHTLGDAITLAAVARGARVIEKHFTIAKDLAGPDHLMSLDPGELTSMVARIRMVEASLGDGRKRPVESERETIVVARRSLFAARDIAAGAVLSAEDFVALRPGDGLSPMHQKAMIGRRARTATPAGSKLELSLAE